MDWKKAAPYIAAVGAALVLSIAYAEFIGPGRDSSGDAFEARIPAVEFLYLDGERVLEYLAQLEGGSVGSVRRISKEISKVEGGAAEGPFRVSASSQHVDSAESTVTRTETSAMGLLLAKLEDNERDFVHYHDIELNTVADLRDVREGMLVKFVTHYLLSPGYIRPYVVVRQSATLAALFPHGQGNDSGADSAVEQQRRAKSFARQVGPDPRLTFAVSPPPADGAQKRLRLLLPMRYSGLTEERSLLERGPDEYTGGRLVVVGKVVRLFRHRVRCEDDVCYGRAAPEYTDFATRETWRHPLEGASNYLIDHVSHSCSTPRSEEVRQRRMRAEKPPSPLEGRPCFLRKLVLQTELHAPGAVILPIAIWK
ncbi:MAG TPA: hypothetical protein VF125_11990 [Solirubrobacterales bacterium]